MRTLATLTGPLAVPRINTVGEFGAVECKRMDIKYLLFVRC
jgi:hypothetical protein